IRVTNDDNKALLAFADHQSEKIEARGRPTNVTIDNGMQANAPPQESQPPPEQTKKDDVKPPPPLAKKEDEKKKADEEKKKVVVVEKKDEKKPAAPPLQSQPQKDKRIAVRQHVQKNQQDNPDAPFVGDEANTVKEQTVATMTS